MEKENLTPNNRRVQNVNLNPIDIKIQSDSLNTV